MKYYTKKILEPFFLHLAMSGSILVKNDFSLWKKVQKH